MEVCKVIAFDIGTKHLAYCALHDDQHMGFEDFKTENIKFDIIDISAKLPINRLKKLKESLDSLPEPGLVVIEQQVSTNIVAMTLQSAITMYYLVKDVPVQFYNPKDKFKIDGYKNFKGKEHKQVSISYARNILEKKNKELLTKFESYKKKDDIADALCMALFVLIDDDNILSQLIHS